VHFGQTKAEVKGKCLSASVIKEKIRDSVEVSLGIGGVDVLMPSQIVFDDPFIFCRLTDDLACVRILACVSHREHAVEGVEQTVLVGGGNYDLGCALGLKLLT
jgi:hypothetical protein